MSDRLHQFLPHIVIHPIEGRIVKPLQSQPDKFNPLIARQLALSQESDNCHYIANIRGQSLKGAENIIAETSRRHSIYKSSEWPISIKFCPCIRVLSGFVEVSRIHMQQLIYEMTNGKLVIGFCLVRQFPVYLLLNC